MRSADVNGVLPLIYESCMLSCMRESTTIRVAPATRDALRRLADSDGVNMDQAIARLLRAERQRRMGAALAATELTDSERVWTDVGVATVADHARR